MKKFYFSPTLLSSPHRCLRSKPTQARPTCKVHVVPLSTRWQRSGARPTTTHSSPPAALCSLLPLSSTHGHPARRAGWAVEAVEEQEAGQGGGRVAPLGSPQAGRSPPPSTALQDYGGPSSNRQSIESKFVLFLGGWGWGIFSNTRLQVKLTSSGSLYDSPSPTTA